MQINIYICPNKNKLNIMELEKVLQGIEKKLNDGMLTKIGLAKFLNMPYSTLMHRLKVNNWRYAEVEKMKELL